MMIITLLSDKSQEEEMQSSVGEAETYAKKSEDNETHLSLVLAMIYYIIAHDEDLEAKKAKRTSTHTPTATALFTTEGVVAFDSNHAHTISTPCQGRGIGKEPVICELCRGIGQIQRRIQL